MRSYRQSDRQNCSGFGLMPIVAAIRKLKPSSCYTAFPLSSADPACGSPWPWYQSIRSSTPPLICSDTAQRFLHDWQLAQAPVDGFALGSATYRQPGGLEADGAVPAPHPPAAFAGGGRRFRSAVAFPARSTSPIRTTKHPPDRRLSRRPGLRRPRIPPGNGGQTGAGMTLDTRQNSWPAGHGTNATGPPRRSDAGVMRFTGRDITGLVLAGDMYGVPYDLLGVALGARPARVRAVTRRWRQAGLARIRAVLAIRIT